MKNKIEFREAGGGNQLRQPYIKKYVSIKNFLNFQMLSVFIFWILYRKLSRSIFIKNKKIVNILNNFSTNKFMIRKNKKKKPKKNKILLTGGAGYIGSMLSTELINLGYKVTVIDLLKYEKSSLIIFI